jgi:hypothetical protein
MSSTFDDVAEIARGPVGYLVVGLVVVGVVYLLYSKVKTALPAIDPAKNATDSCGNPETSYESVVQSSGPLAGAVAELGATANWFSCGWLATLGCKISRIGCNYDPNATSSPVACSDPVEGGYIFADRMRRPVAQKSATIPTSNQSKERSGAIQSWSARPYQSGNNAAYADAFDSSPPDPSYTMNVLVTEPLAGYIGN